MEWNNDEISKLIDFIEKRLFIYVICHFSGARNCDELASNFSCKFLLTVCGACVAGFMLLGVCRGDCSTRDVWWSTVRGLHRRQSRSCQLCRSQGTGFSTEWNSVRHSRWWPALWQPAKVILIFFVTFGQSTLSTKQRGTSNRAAVILDAAAQCSVVPERIRQWQFSYISIDQELGRHWNMS